MRCAPVAVAVPGCPPALLYEQSPAEASVAAVEVSAAAVHFLHWFPEDFQFLTLFPFSNTEPSRIFKNNSYFMTVHCMQLHESILTQND